MLHALSLACSRIAKEQRSHHVTILNTNRRRSGRPQSPEPGLQSSSRQETTKQQATKQKPFLIQALHGIKSNRVTNKISDSILLKKQAKQIKTSPATRRATPIPLARIGVPRAQENTKRASECQRGGKRALRKSHKNCASAQAKKRSRRSV